MNQKEPGSSGNDNSSLYALIVGVFTAMAAISVLIIGKASRRKNFPEPHSLAAQNSGRQSANDPMIEATRIQKPSISTETEIHGQAPQKKDVSETTIWSDTTKYIFGVGLFLFLILLLYFARSVLPLVILGGLMAFVAQPVIRFFRESLHLRRGLAISLTYFLAFLIIILLPLILVPSIINAIQLVSEIDVQQLVLDFTIRVAEFAAQASTLPIIGPIIESLFSPLIESLEKLTANQAGEALDLNIAYGELITQLSSTLGVLVRAVGAVSSAVVAVFFSLFISIYLSFDAHKLRGFLPRLLPPAYKSEMESLLQRIGMIWEGFLRGQIILMFIIGVVVWLGTAILGLPQPVFFGFLSGTLEMIPSLGPLLAFIPAVSVAWIFGSTHLPVSNFTFALIIAGFYLLVQFLENQFIVPRVLGRAVDLHPLVVLIGALAAGSQFGILGIFLAAPMIATLREIIQYIYQKILESPPIPIPEEKKTIMDDVRAFSKKTLNLILKPFRRFVL